MKLLIGLGNPGQKYAKNRHNTGHMLVDLLNKKNSGFIAKKTDVFMNSSGEFVKQMVNKYPDSELFVAYDDLDIPLGKFKIQKGRGPKDHNGVNSVYDALKSRDFWSVRIGVENRSRENFTEGEEYVLLDFTEGELVILEKALREVCRKLATF